jgi:alanyl-tRNA synthetase
MSKRRTAAQVRESFLAFFEKRGHTRVASSSLVPSNDPTLLFTNAGMVQFKDVFTGREKRDYRRATSSQKCVRAGGKHNDLDNVGFTARHHTFFEMLGNFSFGDYFKADAVPFAWEFVTRDLGIQPQRLAATVFAGEEGIPSDEEAFQLWRKQGLPEQRIERLGKDDNFWAMGDTGPCGPCSELHFHQGDDLPCAAEAAGSRCLGVACDCDRWLEIWNLVFMQFERRVKDGPLEPLPRPSIDTGAGLERMAAVVEGVRSNYDTDLFAPLIERAAELSGRTYGRTAEDDASMRVIADHSRATAFLIADGVQPSNEGRGYVLRRIMRRAIRHGARLGLEEPFFDRTVDRVIELMAPVYAELRENRSFVLEATRHEEESFRRTLDRGLRLLDEEMARVRAAGGKQVSGEVVFFLHGTHGFPWDLTQVIAHEHGLDIDVAGYEQRMAEEKEKGGGFAGSGDQAIADLWPRLRERLGADTEFLGYQGEGEVGDGKVLAILQEGHEVEEAMAPGRALVVTDRTPFYGEAGGQVGDTGRMERPDGSLGARVLDTQRPVPGLFAHQVQLEKGILRVGDAVHLSVDAERRRAIRRNHSATHLLHRALKVVLGDHVKQAGSVVHPDYLRFDYAHFQAPSPRKLEEVEDLVNRWIRENADAATQVMGLDEAKAAGAVALFGEKYGDRVRVVSVHPESTELCGGTHVRRSGDIGFFKITGESSIASGVRRIVAMTGAGAAAWVRELEHEVRRAAELLRTSPKELVKRVEATQKRVKELEREVETVGLQASSGTVDVFSQVREVNGIKVLATRVDPADAKRYRGLADQYRDRLRSGVVVVWGEKDGKGLVLVAATKDLVEKGLSAGDLVREVARETGGAGGGRADLAQAGGGDPALLPRAVERLVARVGS